MYDIKVQSVTFKGVIITGGKTLPININTTDATVNSKGAIKKLDAFLVTISQVFLVAAKTPLSAFKKKIACAAKNVAIIKESATGFIIGTAKDIHDAIKINKNITSVAGMLNTNNPPSICRIDSL